MCKHQYCVMQDKHNWAATFNIWCAVLYNTSCVHTTQNTTLSASSALVAHNTGDAHTTWVTTVMHLQHLLCTTGAMRAQDNTTQMMRAQYLLCTTLVVHNTSDTHTTVVVHNTNDAHTTGVMLHNSCCAQHGWCAHKTTQQRWCVHNSADGAQQHASVAARLRWRSELAWVRLTWGKAELSETKNSSRWPNWANLAGTVKCCWFQESEVLEAKMSQGRVWQLTPHQPRWAHVDNSTILCQLHLQSNIPSNLHLLWISVTLKGRVSLDIFRIAIFRSEQPTSPICPIMYYAQQVLYKNKEIFCETLPLTRHNLHQECRVSSHVFCTLRLSSYTLHFLDVIASHSSYSCGWVSEWGRIFKLSQRSQSHALRIKHWESYSDNHTLGIILSEHIMRITPISWQGSYPYLRKLTPTAGRGGRQSISYIRYWKLFCKFCSQ